LLPAVSHPDAPELLTARQPLALLAVEVVALANIVARQRANNALGRVVAAEAAAGREHRQAVGVRYRRRRIGVARIVGELILRSGRGVGPGVVERVGDDDAEHLGADAEVARQWNDVGEAAVLDSAG